MIYDITRTISPRLAVWPGDTPFSYTFNVRLSDGDIVNLTTLTMSAHTGTHADAHFHYADDGQHPAQMPLDAYIGPAQVVTVVKRGEPLTPDDLAHIDLTQVTRLLIHSYVSDLNDEQWPEAYPSLSIELIDWLAEKAIILVGLDSPSVDAPDSTDLPCHHALYRHKIVNLENLQLRDVPDGRYELIALPLKIDQVCGSPIRAILRTLS